jgi:hypothetical protein
LGDVSVNINPKAISDLSIPIHDLVHGELKNLMLAAEEYIESSDEDLAIYWSGRLDSYLDVYKLIYDLIFVREDLDK